MVIEMKIFFKLNEDKKINNYWNVNEKKPIPAVGQWLMERSICLSSPMSFRQYILLRIGTNSPRGWIAFITPLLCIPHHIPLSPLSPSASPSLCLSLFPIPSVCHSSRRQISSWISGLADFVAGKQSGAHIWLGRLDTAIYTYSHPLPPLPYPLLCPPLGIWHKP